MLARYLDRMDTSEIMFLEDVKGFAWNNPPEANFVDQLSFQKLKQLKILPSDLCSDEECKEHYRCNEVELLDFRVIPPCASENNPRA